MLRTIGKPSARRGARGLGFVAFQPTIEK